MGRDGVTCATLEEEGTTGRMRLFLYGKGLFSEKATAARVAEFDDLLYPARADVREETRARLEKGHLRLRRIVVDGGTSAPIERDRNTFTAFCEKLPGWAEPQTSYVVFRDHPALAKKRNVFVERLQPGGLSYMHAPIVLQHYLVQMTRDEPAGMIDVCAYLRQQMSHERLRCHLWDDAGDDSTAFLSRILVKGSKSASASRNWLEELRKHGPLLVSHVRIEQAFFDCETLVHTGECSDEYVGLHAMVMVGHRKVGDKDRFLLQNWWDTKVSAVKLFRFKFVTIFCSLLSKSTPSIWTIASQVFSL
jgi:hypothetical protein